MTIASDNPFPSVLLVEGDPEDLPSDPSSGQRRLVVGLDHLLYLVDDAGVATEVGGGSGENVATSAIWDAAGDILLGTGANTGSRLPIGTSGHVLRSNGTTAAWAAVTPGAYESFLSADTTCVNANSLYSAASLALTPPAGDYLVMARLLFTSASSSATGVSAMIATGGSLASDVLTGHTAIADNWAYNPGSNGGGGQTIVVFARVSLDGSTPVRAALFSVRGTSDTVIRTTNPQSGGTTNKASSIVATRIVSL